MAPKFKQRGARPVSDLISKILDPALRKKAGISVGLLQNWPQIAGTELAELTRPQKIDWPNRYGNDEPFRPGILVLACDQAMVLKLQYQTTELISRVNTFFGYAAVNRIRIIQKPVTPWREPPAKPPRDLSEDEQRHLDDLTQNIDDPELRKSLEKLGRSIIGERSP